MDYETGIWTKYPSQATSDDTIHACELESWKYTILSSGEIKKFVTKFEKILMTENLKLLPI